MRNPENHVLKAYAPVLGIGVVGGAVIGLAAGVWVA